MTKHNYARDAKADLPDTSFHFMRAMILSQAKAADLKVLEDTQNQLIVETSHGLIGLCPGQQTEVAGIVATTDERELFILKNAVVQQLKRVLPEVAEAMRWSNGRSETELPPNFQFVRAIKVAPLGPVFLRVILQGEDLSKHDDSSIHFRLVQPPADTSPEWPSVAANGSVKWPDGPRAPHKPVYTARRVDHTLNQLETDIFIHDGGRTTTWAQEILSGQQGRRIVGLMGPAGGGVMEADQVLMASDETGFPAAARILENLPETATGEIFLEAENGAECAYPIQAPKGIQLKWLSRANGEALKKTTLDALPNHKSSKVWFAGEKVDASEVREATKNMNFDNSNQRISGFWRRND